MQKGIKIIYASDKFPTVEEKTDLNTSYQCENTVTKRQTQSYGISEEKDGDSVVKGNWRDLIKNVIENSGLPYSRKGT